MADANVTPQWETTTIFYPSGAKILRTCIVIGSRGEGLRDGYYHVEGGFATDWIRANSKVYTDESAIRRMLLKKMRKKVLAWQQEIDAALKEA